MTFTSDDLGLLASLVAEGWRSAADRDWSVPAGDPWSDLLRASGRRLGRRPA